MGLYFFHPCQLPTAELHYDAVQPGVLYHLPDAGGFGVEAELPYGVLPLVFGVGFVVLGGEVFQLQNVAVLHFGIPHEVGHQEEVAEAVVHFHLGCGEVVGVDAEVGLQEALDVSFTLYLAAHGGVVLVGLGDEFEGGTPLAVVGHVFVDASQIAQVEAVGGGFLELFQQVFVVLLAYVVVGDAQHQLVAVRTGEGEHAVVEEQAGEHLGVSDSLGGEGGEEFGGDPSFLGDAVHHAPAVAVQMIELDELLHLGIVGAGVGVYHLFGRAAFIYIVPQIVEHHVAVEHLGVTVQTGFGEAVVVVPGFHFGNHLVDVSVVPASILVVLQDAPDVGLAEAEHLVELGLDGDVPADVEAAAEVVEGDGADADHEDALEHALELLEHFAVEAGGVGDSVVYLVALLVEHVVGEVVVLVDDEVEAGSAVLGFPVQEVQLLGGGGLLFHLLGESGIVARLVDGGEVVQASAAIVVEVAGEFFAHSAAYTGEVHVQHLIHALQGCGAAAYPEVAEACPELVLLREVVIGFQHAQEDALTEAAGADEEQVAGLLLQQGQVHGLVYIILVLLHYFGEAGDAVGYSFDIFHIGACF